MSKATTIPWQNGLGYDVNGHEVWLLTGGEWGVRTFRNGKPCKFLRLHPKEGRRFPLRPVDAVALCLARGEKTDA